MDGVLAELLGRQNGLMGGKGGSMHLSDVARGMMGSYAIIGAHLTLANGTATVQATLNAAGSFTFTANDESDPTIPDGVSSLVSALLLQGFEFARINQKNQYAGAAMTTTIGYATTMIRAAETITRKTATAIPFVSTWTHVPAMTT